MHLEMEYGLIFKLFFVMGVYFGFGSTNKCVYNEPYIYRQYHLSREFKGCSSGDDNWYYIDEQGYVWIGKEFKDTNTWAWTDGRNVTHIREGFLQGDGNGGYGCAHMVVSTKDSTVKVLDSMKCEEKLQFFCMFTEYISNSNSHEDDIEDIMSWFNAQKFCENTYDGKLADYPEEFESATEKERYTFLKEHMGEEVREGTYWIGLTHLGWRWTNGTYTTYTNNSKIEVLGEEVDVKKCIKQYSIPQQCSALFANVCLNYQDKIARDHCSHPDQNKHKKGLVVGLTVPAVLLLIFVIVVIIIVLIRMKHLKSRQHSSNSRMSYPEDGSISRHEGGSLNMESNGSITPESESVRVSPNMEKTATISRTSTNESTEESAIYAKPDKNKKTEKHDKRIDPDDVIMVENDIYRT